MTSITQILILSSDYTVTLNDLLFLITSSSSLNQLEFVDEGDLFLEDDLFRAEFYLLPISYLSSRVRKVRNFKSNGVG